MKSPLRCLLFLPLFFFLVGCSPTKEVTQPKESPPSPTLEQAEFQTPLLLEKGETITLFHPETEEPLGSLVYFPKEPQVLKIYKDESGFSHLGSHFSGREFFVDIGPEIPEFIEIESTTTGEKLRIPKASPLSPYFKVLRSSLTQTLKIPLNTRFSVIGGTDLSREIILSKELSFEVNSIFQKGNGVQINWFSFNHQRLILKIHDKSGKRVFIYDQMEVPGPKSLFIQNEKIWVLGSYFITFEGENEKQGPFKLAFYPAR